MATRTMRSWLYSTTTGANSGNGLHKNLVLSPKARAPQFTSKNGSKGGKELLIRVGASSLNAADHKIPELLPTSLLSRMLGGLPASPGTDFAGTVVEASGNGGGGKSSSSSPSLSPGDTVFGRLDKPTRFGALGELVVAREDWVAKMKKDSPITFEQASGVPTAGLVALGSLRRWIPDSSCSTPPSSTAADDKKFHVLINGGSGGVGTFAIQIAKVLGCRVTAVCSSGKKEMCLRLGADEVVEYDQISKKDSLVKVLEGKGMIFDHVVDNVGATSAQPVAEDLYYAADKFLRPGGTFVQVGAEMSGKGMGRITGRMMWPGWLGGGRRKYELFQLKTEKEGLETLGRWMEEGRIRTVVDETFEFGEAPRAVEKMRMGHAAGKIVVKGVVE